MVVTVDEGEFAELADRLGITPKNAVNIILCRMKNLPYYVNSAAKNKSLDKALETLLDCSGITYAWDEAIKEIVGDRRCAVEESEVDLQEGRVWYRVVSVTDDDSEIDSLELQFGNDSGETIYASVHVVLGSGKLGDDAVAEIYDKMYSMGPETDYEPNLVHDYNDGVLSFSITFHTGNSFDLPKFDQMDELVKEVKEIIRSHGAQSG